MQTTPTIEAGIPIPLANNDKYRFRELAVGESRHYEVGSERAGSVRVAARSAGVRHNMKFAGRTTSRGIRIWRTA